MIVSVVSTTRFQTATLDLSHEAVDRLCGKQCWFFHNQDLSRPGRSISRKETLLDGLVHQRGKGKPSETLRITAFEPGTGGASQAHWFETVDAAGWRLCEMLNFIDWLSRTSAKGITISAKEPPRAMIQPGGLPLDRMKCVRVTQP
jgi:hypothetical protein